MKKIKIPIDTISTILEILFFISIMYCIWDLPYCFKIIGTIATLLLGYLFTYQLNLKK